VSVVATLIIITIAFTAGLLLAPQVTGEAQAAPVVQAEQPGIDSEQIVAAYEQAFIEVYRDTIPSVVSIIVTKEFDERDFGPFGFGDPDEDDEEDEDESTPDEEEGPDIPPEFFNQGGGTGFVWDTDGHIITNYHVVAGATDIDVIFSNEKVVKAELVGSDPDADLAVIKVDLPADELRPVTVGDSSALQVGQLAIALGNPFGQEFTMTTGIISGIGRTIRSGNSGFSIPEVIQTDAPINPGNSGGPLLNRHGEVIGINTQMLSQSGSSSGIGFAVPINIAKRVVPTLVEGETYQYSWLGISGSSMTAEAVEFRHLPAETRGALVVSVIEDGPAAAAGLQGRDESLAMDSDEYLYGGDLITAINGQMILDMDDLITYLVNQTQPGDKVTLEVTRADGTKVSVEVTLGVRPNILNTPQDDDDE
jgi:2-alkenal reductase